MMLVASLVVFSTVMSVVELTEVAHSVVVDAAATVLVSRPYFRVHLYKYRKIYI